MKEINNKPSVLLWCVGIDDVLNGTSKVAGIQVLMSFWAKTFIKHNWNVYTFSKHKDSDIDGVRFMLRKESFLGRHGLSIIDEFIEARKVLKNVKPNVVFVHGARRQLYAIAKLCRRHNIKLVFLPSSDKDLQPGDELFTGLKITNVIYQKSIKYIDYHVTQNQFQADKLKEHYTKDSIIIPDIWPESETRNIIETPNSYDAIWVANLRRLKRVEWFIRLAKRLPQYKFAIVGGVNEQDYYDEMKEEAAKVANLDFYGAQPLYAVNGLLSQSKMLVCTSEFEGFPNTFLQAWAYNVPIVSTVNPTNCISDFGLGAVVENEEQLLHHVTELLENSDKYKRCQENIKDYFVSHHDADMAYEKVMMLINLDKKK